MKIENQVASLELCKRLKELGVNKTSFARWFADEVTGYEFVVHENSIVNSERKYPERCAAYTCSELGEILPETIEIEDAEHYLKYYKLKDKWRCDLTEDGRYNMDIPHHYTISASEADSRALMLIYLIENGQVKVDDL